MKLVLATRRSRLALWQAEATRRALSAAWSDLEVELCEIESSGDLNQRDALARFGRIGIFTVEVDQAVLDGRAHGAVHSLKDTTTTLADGIELAGVLARGPVEDCWIARDGKTIEEQAPGARVATGSLRRRAMLRALRPDLALVEMRGNVDTRLRKLADGDADALILARAGLARLGLEQHVTTVLDTRRFVPAVGQGLIGLTCRAGDRETRRRLRAVTDLEAWDEAMAERALLRELRGGCNVPVGGHARVVEGTLALRARVSSVDGSERLDGEITGSRDAAQELGRLLADDLLRRGARRLIDLARA